MSKNLGRVGFVEKGTWSNSATYDKFDVVTVAGYGSYRSRTNNNKGNNPTSDSTNWAPVASGQYAKEQGDYAKAQGDAANAAAGRAPYIGENGHWFVWNVQTNQYVDTDIPADAESLKANIADLLSGNLVPALAGNLSNWDGRNGDVTDAWTDGIRTAAGSTSIDSSKGATLLEILPKDGDITVQSLVASGFNLLNANFATELSTNVWYIPVPALPFGTISTAEQPNGVLFTNEAGENLRPTVYFKPLSSGVPTSATDGTACAYTDATAGGKSYRFYTTSQAGYLIVSGFTRATTCAHLGWSRRYDEYIAPTEATDAGTVASLSTVGTLRYLSAVVRDSMKRVSSSQAKVTRMVGYAEKAAASWTNTLNDDGETYTHTATISGMLADGIAELADGTPLAVAGKTVSVQDTNATMPAVFVKYQLETETTSTVSVASDLDIEDWGIEMLRGTGKAHVTTQYSQGYPDAVAAIAASRMPAAENSIGTLADAYEREAWEDAESADFRELPMLCGQPMKLYGNGTPQEAVVPTNWIQLADGGYDWNGIPSAIGQEYINTASGGGKYEAVRDGNYSLKWQAV